MDYSSSMTPIDSPSTSKASRAFNTHEVKEMLTQLVQQTIDLHRIYDAEQCTQLSKDLSQTVKDALKAFNYERYKYVTQVVIGECKDENLMMTCRCLWDLETDNYASYVYSNGDIFCAVTVFGLFYY